MAHHCVLVPPSGQHEMLPRGTCPREALEQGMLYSLALGDRVLYYGMQVMHWQINDFATKLVGQPVSGDVCILDKASSSAELLVWLKGLQTNLERYSLSAERSRTRKDATPPKQDTTTPVAGGSSPAPAGNPPEQAANSPLHAVTATSVPAPPASPALPETTLDGQAMTAQPPEASGPVQSTFEASGPVQLTSTPAPQRPHRPSQAFSLGDSDTIVADPRQALMWAIAGRATSMCWTPDQEAAGGARPNGARRSSTSAAAAAISPRSATAATSREAAGAAAPPTPQTVAAACSAAVVHVQQLPKVQAPAPVLASPAAAAVPSAQPDSRRARRASADLPPKVRDPSQQQQGYCTSPTPPLPPMLGPDWDGLAPELLGLVLRQLDGHVGAAVAMAGVSRRWRTGLCSENDALRTLRVLLNARGPLRSPNGRPVPLHLLRNMDCPPLPLLVQQSALAGNESACVACAALLDAQRRPADGMRYWKRAAKLGHAGAQVRMGEAYYRGCHGIQRDSEEALCWLLRGAKQLLPSADAAASTASAATTTTLVPGGVDSPLAAANGAAASTGAADDADADHDLLGQPQVVPQQQGSCPELASASLLLGYLHLDGEGSLKPDFKEAVSWFKVAARAGSKEAEKALGMLYNTGQYG